MITLVIIIGCLGLLLLVPVGVKIEYGEEALKTRLTIGGFSLPLTGKKKKKKPKKIKKNKPHKKQKNREPNEVVQKKKVHVKSIFQMIPELMDLLSELASIVHRKLQIKQLTLKVVVGADNAAKAAISYGKVWLVLGGAVAVIENLFHIQNRDVDVVLDYQKEDIEMDIQVDIRMRVGTLFHMAGISGWKIVKNIKKYKKVVNNNESSSQ